jgi:hypothetical protein
MCANRADVRKQQRQRFGVRWQAARDQIRMFDLE